MSDDRYSLYIQNLPVGVTKEEVRSFFGKYKLYSVVMVNVKSLTTVSAVVEFKHRSDAKHVLKKYNGRAYGENILRLEYRKRFGNQNSTRQADEPKRDTCDYEFSCKIFGIPRGTNWRDLKTFLRQYCTSEYCNIDEDGVGLIGFFTRQDMDYAIKKFSRKSYFMDGKPVTLVLKPNQLPSKRRSRSSEK
ncbi:Serine/arginine-rich splicing factor 9 [Thelohanellus kitauei]|uniref:Serine/arginine-rich splicing factor 9 n=1 Tax=Thelohanellus kitauei TaxID=669202 RepID=A0A0C2MU69_THEKT|nr:Serine/arginine-rich splicing factor 9 [Thelohanellus kitauei]